VRITHGSAVRPKRGERECGDAIVVRADGERTLLAVVDALGHGPVAAEIAALACAHLRTISLDGEILAMIQGLHFALKGSRGAAAMLCRIEGTRISACGVGNVEVRAQGTSLSSVLSPGILGVAVRKFQTFAGEVGPGTRLVLFSDGISQHFALADVRTVGAKEASESILSRHGRDHDDAAVLVADVED